MVEIKMTINNFDIDQEIQPHFDRVWETSASYVLLSGGRGSFKSSTIALKLVFDIIQRMNEHEIANVVVIRKVGSTIADSVWLKMQWALNKFGLKGSYRAFKSPFRIVLTGGSTIHFYGQDDFAKLRSNDINNMIAVWYEEASEFKDPEEFDQTNQTFVRQKHPAVEAVKFYWSWNPPRDPYHWINKWREIQRHKTGWLVDQSSYLDDELGWLNHQQLTEIEQIKKTDEDYYRYLFLGEAVGLGSNVYNMNLFHPLQAIPADEELVNIYFSQDSGQQISATTESCYGITNKDKVILLNTYYYSPVGKVNKKAPSDLAKAIHEFEEKCISNWGMNPWQRSADSATSDFALAHEIYKLYSVEYSHVAKTEKAQMIDHVQNLLSTGRFFYLDTSENKIFITQHQQYRWDDNTLTSGKARVIKENDHTCDQFQYFVLDNLRDLDLIW